MAILLVGGFGLFGNVFIIFFAIKYIVRKNIHYLSINMAVSDVLVAFMSSFDIVKDLLRYNLWDNVDGHSLDHKYRMISSDEVNCTQNTPIHTNTTCGSHLLLVAHSHGTMCLCYLWLAHWEMGTYTIACGLVIS